MDNTNQFDWVDFYKELASKLLQYRDNRQELVEKVRKIFETTGIDLPTLERDNEIEDIDPFTVFGLFNKSSLRKDNRKKIISAVADLFGVTAPVPSSFDGIPTLFNMNAVFYHFIGDKDREEGEIDDLWALFESALAYAASPTPDNRTKLSKYFDLTINKKDNGNSKITMGMYWIAPNSFLNLDGRNTWYIYESGKIPAELVQTLPAIEENISSAKYFDIVEKLRSYLQSEESSLKDFKELSFEAWRYSEEVNRAKKVRAERESKGAALADEDVETETAAQGELNRQLKEYKNPFSSMLIASKNLIFRGAPGTGKSYLAKKIAADIISLGSCDNYKELNDEQKKQVEFVQFHPSYDYSDFVEGLRPKLNDDGTMGFELQDGIFKKFVARARKNYEDSQKSVEAIENEISVQEAMAEFFSNIELGVDTFKTINGNEFTITGVDDKHINISIPGNATVNKLTLNLDEIRKMLESGQRFNKIKDITSFFGKSFATQAYSYDFAIYKAIRAKKSTASKAKPKQEELKNYIFIIDEINRGEISKIFGELFFAIDPEYRGRDGEISTQYSNLHSDPDEKFYVPENVYIIGTMNDIDRSVDSFDFAMRRRFRFVELKANDCKEMLASLEDEELKAEAIKRISALNKEIADVEDLNENYQIGASYFLKLKTLDFDQLWTDYLQPLLQEYIRGMYDEKKLMEGFAEAYGYKKPAEGDVNETTQD